MDHLLIHCDFAHAPLRRCVSDVWDSLGHAGVCCKSIVLLEKLVREIWLRCLEYGAGLFDVDYSGIVVHNVHSFFS